MLNKILPVTGDEPRTSGIESNRSTNWATTTSHTEIKFGECKRERVSEWAILMFEWESERDKILRAVNSQLAMALIAIER